MRNSAATEPFKRGSRACSSHRWSRSSERRPLRTVSRRCFSPTAGPRGPCELACESRVALPLGLAALPASVVSNATRRHFRSGSITCRATPKHRPARDVAGVGRGRCTRRWSRWYGARRTRAAFQGQGLEAAFVRSIPPGPWVLSRSRRPCSASSPSLPTSRRPSANIGT